jgi:hypothetical protein
MSEHTGADKPATKMPLPPGKIEITERMIDAGFDRLCGFDIAHPNPDEVRSAVSAVFCAMLQARPRSYRLPGVPRRRGGV